MIDTTIIPSERDRLSGRYPWLNDSLNETGGPLKMENLCVYITRRFYNTAIEAEHGEAHVLVAEMAELTKEIMCYYHDPDRTDQSMAKIIEELSHVLISCRTFQISAHISNEALQAEINKKYLKHGLAPEA